LTLAGFSQGAMLSVDTVIRGLAEPPGKLVVMSGALICESLWKAKADRLRKLPVLQSHGRSDSILPIQTGRWLKQFFEASLCNLEYLEFNGDHTIPYEIYPMIAKSQA
jgi:phospholipase/carboxylesterase